MSPTLVPVQGVTRVGLAAEDTLGANHGASGYLTSTLAQTDLHGAGHLGVAPLDRIIMSLKSGLESEIEHALSTLTFYLCNDPKLVDFAAYPLIGHQLIAIFGKPYITHGKTGKSGTPTSAQILASVEALLALRNAAQDLHNQQWLCQAPYFREYAVNALKFLSEWHFSATAKRPYALTQHSDVFRESLRHLLDLLDPITCFYVDTPKNDPLFQQLLVLLSHGSNDKAVVCVVLKCLQHLLFLGSGEASPRHSDNNCIDAISAEHLRMAVRLLLVNDAEVHFATLLFLQQYLLSEAVHVQHKHSLQQSQLLRLHKLVDASASSSTGPASNLHILLKQLPELVVARLPLVDPSQLPHAPPLQLQKRSAYSGVPAVTAKLPQDLYDIILTFPEPLRATTWLRCCYEPLVILKLQLSRGELAAGEVTQISLWKLYENQFEAIWKDRFNPKWPNLLPAVDFIKNVSSAFPSSEAMVVSVSSPDASQPARKKFIIKGIQPRQFPVSIDIGNFEALRKSNNAALEESSVGAATAGEVDANSFKENMNVFVDSILAASDGLTDPHDTSAPWYSPINVLSRDLLQRIISALVETDLEGIYRSVFRQYNRDWLPDLVFANPGLVEHSYIDGKWLQYLL